MRVKVYCAHHSIRYHWALRCMSRCPDEAKKLEKPLLTNRKICRPQATKTKKSTLSPLSLDKTHHARLGQYAANLWKDKVLTDVIIIVQNHEFKTHKAVLACYSPYFADAFVRPGFSDVHYGRIIGLREAGWSNRRIGRHLGRSDMVVARCWQQWITEGRVYRRGGSGRPRNTNDREDRAIRRVATSAPTTSLASIQRHLPPSRHPVPSRETIRRRLTEVLRSRRPLRRLPLTPHHSVDWILPTSGNLECDRLETCHLQ
ncbi:BTB domain-containing protein [Trichonephila clavipes]|nr:BTB domain-containing protein [Trichonephila clavipes]